MHRWCALNITWTPWIFIAGCRIFAAIIRGSQRSNQHITCMFSMLDKHIQLAHFSSISCNVHQWQDQVHYHMHLIPLEGYICKMWDLNIHPVSLIWSNSHLWWCMIILSCIIKLAIPLLEEANEGGNSCARPDHYEGHRQVSRRSKGAVGSQTHMDLGSEAISRHLKIMRVITTMLRSHCGTTNLLIDLLNILRHTNRETQELQLESTESVAERIYFL